MVCQRCQLGWTVSHHDSMKLAGNVLGDNPGYPIPWGALQGASFQPLCFKYLDRVIVDDRLRPSLADYR